MFIRLITKEIRASSRLPSAQRFRHTYPSSRKGTCPSCGAALRSRLPACTNCWHISRLPSDTKFHDIFGLSYHPNPFVVDLVTLKQRFRDAQAVCHPDSWASKGSNKQGLAQDLSSHINKAYQSLLTPLSRVEYLLERHYLPISETDQVDNVEFMTEVMQARETIEEAASQEDVQSLIDENRAKIQNTVAELETLVGQEKWENVKIAAVRLRYLEGIDRAAKEWMENHFQPCI